MKAREYGSGKPPEGEKEIFECTNPQMIVGKALVDIEGEKNLVQDPDDLTTSDWHKPESEDPDWKRLKECVTGLSKWVKNGGNPLMTGEDYLNIAKCTLWLKGQISEINNTLLDMQPEIIGMEKEKES